jgi:hypothetical protein
MPDLVSQVNNATLADLDNAVGDKLSGHVAHALVEQMANPDIANTSNQGRDNFTAAAIRAAGGSGHNWDDESRAEAAIGRLNPGRSNQEDVAHANQELENCVIIAPNIGKGRRW